MKPTTDTMGGGVAGGRWDLDIERDGNELLSSEPSVSLEELVRIGTESSKSPSFQVTPRPSIASTALTDDFARTLYKINAGLKEMRRMSGKLGGPADSHEHRAKLNALTEVNKDMIMRANSDLKRLGKSGHIADSERSRLTSLTRDFQLLMEEFQEIQKLSLQKCQEFIIRAQAITREGQPVSSPTDSPDIFLSGEPQEKAATTETTPLVGPPGSIGAVGTLSSTQDVSGLENEISYNQALIQEREQGIQEIEAAMAEVHEIFCDLGLLVGEQQNYLDSIEANIESSAMRARGAVRELTRARDRQRRRRGNIICMLFFALFVLIMAIAIINAIL